MAEHGRWAMMPAEATTMLVRNHDTVHLRTCSRIARMKVLPWNWAEGRSASEVATARANGLHFCRACEPLLAMRKADDSGSEWHPFRPDCTPEPHTHDGPYSPISGTDHDTP